MAYTQSVLIAVALAAWGCAAAHSLDAGLDGGAPDAGHAFDAGQRDAGQLDGGRDSGPEPGHPVPIPSGRSWSIEEAIARVPRMAYQRTRVEVGADGTPWIAHSLCADSACRASDDGIELVVTHRVAGAWTSEPVAELDVTFWYDLALLDGVSPMLAISGRVTEVHARGPGGWSATAIEDAPPGLNRVALYTGAGEPLLLLGSLAFTTRGSGGGWRALAPVRDDASLIEFGRESVVPWDGALRVAHASRFPAGPETVALSRFDPVARTWTREAERTTGWDSVTGLSAVRFAGELCFVGRHDHHLAMSCERGSAMISTPTPLEQIFGAVVARVLPDGTLAIGYDHWSDERTRLLTLAPGAARWEIETLFEGPGYGISLAVGPDGALSAAFVACGEHPSEDCALLYARRE